MKSKGYKHTKTTTLRTWHTKQYRNSDEWLTEYDQAATLLSQAFKHGLCKNKSQSKSGLLTKNQGTSFGS